MSDMQVFQTSITTKSPIISIIIGKPWEMVDVDMLQIPTSSQNHRQILIILPKWAKVILMAIQTATTIITKLVKVFSNYGLPEILLVATSKVVCYNKHWMHLVERLNRSLLQMLRAYVCHMSQIGRISFIGNVCISDLSSYNNRCIPL